MDFDTLCIHGGKGGYDNTGAIVTPIFQSATFAHPGVGRSTGFDYSRSQNPTREYLEQTVAALEGGCDALAFSTGMAAVTTLMELFSPGDHIIASDDLYGGTIRLFERINRKNGISFSFVSDASGVEAAVTPDTRAVFIETPTNPMMQIIDIAACADIARDNGLLLIVDNTFLTPYFQKPLVLGADIVLHSGTKFLGGHNDTLAGILALKNQETAEKLRFIAKTTGAVLSPFDSFLITRGIKTLAVRMERQQESAKRLVEILLQSDVVTDVYYPGIESSSGFELSRKQASGFGSMISFKVSNSKSAERLLESVKIIKYAESLGGAESLITYPMLQTHADIPEAERIAKGIDDRLIRLSVGLESAEDLIGDLRQALMI